VAHILRVRFNTRHLAWIGLD